MDLCEEACCHMAELLSGLCHQLTECVRSGCWTEAKAVISRVSEHGARFELCNQVPSIVQQVPSVLQTLITCGKRITTMMDYHGAGDVYKRVISIIATMGNGDAETVQCLCEAFRSHFQNLLHCQKLDEATYCLLTTGQHLKTADSELTSHTLCLAYLDLGMELFMKTMVSSATEQLQEAEKYFQKVPVLKGSVTEVKLRTSLGCCYLLSGNRSDSIELLGSSRRMWKDLNWPLEEISFILSTLKHYAEAQLQLNQAQKSSLDNFDDVTEDLIQLHSIYYRCTKSMKAADIFTYLGINAFNTENEKRAIAYFMQCLELYKQVPQSERNSEEILRLLRYIGVACYNTREFDQACIIYHERLDLLDSSQTMDMNRLTQVADCYASLGFTYSRLRNFDKMLLYYERALELESRLTSEDLQLIETNIGSLYHVRAVKLEQQGEHEESVQFYTRAENAFTKALRYSWKSFPFINYGYYLYFRRQFGQSLFFLQQGYLNSVIDKDTVEFDHTEDPILIPDLRRELENRDHVRVPAVVVSLYLKVLAHSHHGDIETARDTVNQLQSEIEGCRFEQYYHEGFGLDNMRALSHSLHGYGLLAVNYRSQALQAFEQALSIAPEYEAAQKNIAQLRKHTKKSKK